MVSNTGGGGVGGGGGGGGGGWPRVWPNTVCVRMFLEIEARSRLRDD